MIERSFSDVPLASHDHPQSMLQSKTTPTTAHLESKVKKAGTGKKRGTEGGGLLCCSNKKSLPKVERLFFFNDRIRNQLCADHMSNYIRTTKYTSWNFLPLSLMYQFKRKANIYFLAQAILNSIPAVSALNPITAYLPLAFVLGVSMLREGLEDYQRYKSDVKTNR